MPVWFMKPGHKACKAKMRSSGCLPSFAYSDFSENSAVVRDVAQQSHVPLRFPVAQAPNFLRFLTLSSVIQLKPLIILIVIDVAGKRVMLLALSHRPSLLLRVAEGP
ncbi:hypothetical protein IG631_10364 [Alternaria alternata]|nr:hypothetical protein IG631_10364 [Alternaria alternata]